MKHLTLHELSASCDGELAGASLDEARRHLAECVECRSRVKRLERVDRLLTQLYSHDPGATWFADAFVETDRVVARLIGQRAPVARIGAGRDVERHRGVEHRAREHALADHVGEG